MNDTTGLLNPDHQQGWWARKTGKQKALIIVGILAFITAIILIVVYTTRTKDKSDPVTTPNPTTPNPIPTTLTPIRTTSTLDPTTSTLDPTTSTTDPTTSTTDPTTSTTDPTTSTTDPTTSTTDPTTSTADPTTSTTDPTTSTTDPTTSTTDPTTNPSQKLCETEACKVAAKVITENIDPKADPCDDFYDFACGKFNEHNKIPEDKSSVGAFARLQEDVEHRVRDIIKSLKDETFNDLKDSKAVKFTKTMFDFCVDNVTLDKAGIEPLKPLVKGLGNWSRSDNTDCKDCLTYWHKIADIIGKYGPHGILSVSIQPDDLAPTKNVWHIDQPSFLVGKEDLVNPDDDKAKKIIEAYKEYIEATSELMKAEGIEADKILEFETALAKAATPEEKRRDPFKMTKKRTLKELQDAQGIDWVSLLTKVLEAAHVEKEVKETDEVILYDEEYVKKLKGVLYEHESVIEDYLGLVLLTSFGKLSTNKFRENLFNFDKVKTGLEKAPIHEDTCIQLVLNKFDFIVGRLYVEKHFPNTEKKASEQIVKNLREAFKNFLSQHKWLDEKTRKKAIEKAEAISVNTGFPQWIKNNTILDKIYPFHGKGKDGMSHLRNTFKIISRESLKKLNEPVDKEYEWPMGPALVNAAYIPSQNSITFPAGILQGVFFSSGKPSSLNYGALGVVAGHEISHGFDDQGAGYDADGSLNNWWSKKAKENFTKKAECFEKQYSDIKDKQTGMKLDGKKTLGENIADNGGVHQSYAAYKKATASSNEGLLPGLTQYNHDQLFFLGHANVWCLNARDEFVRNQIKFNVHSLGRYRVNVPLKNSPDFADAWSCKKGTKMNPEKKCSLW